MKNILLALVTLVAINLSAQTTTATFEDLLSKKDSFLNGKSTAPEPRTYKIDSNGVVFKSTFDTAYGGYWKGDFAVSSMTDTMNGSFTNLYSSANGTGAMNSQVYLIGNGGGGNPVFETLPTVGTTTASIASFYVNNTTYVRRAMENGNMFATAFSASNKDSFVLWVYTDNASNDSFRVDLANFTNSDTTQNFILKEWVKVDVPFPAAQLRFKLVSSDNGGNGMNTPNFFAIDNVQVEFSTSIKTTPKLVFNVYPNPTSSVVYFQNAGEVIEANVISLNGKTVLSVDGVFNNQLNIAKLPSGVYYLKLQNTDGVFGVQKFIKE